MIYSHTRLAVADNSGAKSVMCIKVIGTNRNYGSVGDVLRVTVKSAIPRAKAPKGTLHLAVVVRVKSSVQRSNGSTVRFNDNAVVLLNEARQPLGTRVFGVVAREVRGKFLKIVSLAQEVM